MSREDIIATFDPNGYALRGSGIFGLPFTPREAQLVIVPVPWDVTVSYSSGTSDGPEAILEASGQVDLFFAGAKDAWKLGIAMEEVPEEWKDLNRHYRKKAEQVIDMLADGLTPSDDSDLAVLLDEVNAQCNDLREWIRHHTGELLDSGRMVALLGGDHSTPLGYMQALAEREGEFGILQIDAHADLRDAYEGFTYSHASIMFNALKVKEVSRLVQVGIRDYCEAEAQLSATSNGRICTYYDQDLKSASFLGETWDAQCDRIIAHLPQKVFISFDIDGLDPKMCPGTGTPVPGGLEFAQAVHLMRKVVSSGRRIIGIDLNEVAPSDGEWDANVGARLLYAMCNLMALSQGRLQAE